MQCLGIVGQRVCVFIGLGNNNNNNSNSKQQTKRWATMFIVGFHFTDRLCFVCKMLSTMAKVHVGDDEEENKRGAKRTRCGLRARSL